MERNGSAWGRATTPRRCPRESLNGASGLGWRLRSDLDDAAALHASTADRCSRSGLPFSADDRGSPGQQRFRRRSCEPALRLRKLKTTRHEPAERPPAEAARGQPAASELAATKATEGQFVSDGQRPSPLPPAQADAAPKVEDALHRHKPELRSKRSVSLVTPASRRSASLMKGKLKAVQRELPKVRVGAVRDEVAELKAQVERLKRSHETPASMTEQTAPQPPPQQAPIRGEEDARCSRVERWLSCACAGSTKIAGSTACLAILACCLGLVLPQRPGHGWMSSLGSAALLASTFIASVCVLTVVGYRLFMERRNASCGSGVDGARAESTVGDASVARAAQGEEVVVFESEGVGNLDTDGYRLFEERNFRGALRHIQVQCAGVTPDNVEISHCLSGCTVKITRSSLGGGGLRQRAWHFQFRASDGAFEFLPERARLEAGLLWLVFRCILSSPERQKVFKFPRHFRMADDEDEETDADGCWMDFPAYLPTPRAMHDSLDAEDTTSAA
eukprot:TRINITY_DN11840_c0_g1_i1.p1 TRINITY_DN11840_c0_g1~~TRINITY_DN11840_c0_g1_i1.p1  ORF type:complete len:506 (+),score=81.31 TRINITY_DN11840_c0_g1_i1:118-1635(+)